MKIKYLFPIILPIILTSCEDKIDSSKRFTPTETPPPARMVLVEEYTGSKCVNCPNGHVALESLSEYYNTEENLSQNIGVITVGIHIPNWGYDLEQGGFITPEASNLTPEGITPPQAQVNRNGKVLDRADWGKELNIEIARAPEVTFPDRVTATVSSTEVKVSGTVSAADNFPNALIHVWVVEDGIVFRQLMPDGTRDDNYVHNNVYRAHMNKSVNGDDFPMTRNTVSQFSFTYPVHPNWNTANLRAVVFIETPTSGVLNAVQTPINSL